jgi:1-acyl-sn-glycerol-3-phosphate acyltransferase
MTSPGWLHDPMPQPSPGPAGWLRIVLRGGLLALVVFGGLGLLLALRLVERPLFGARRPVTPYVTQGVCRIACALLGISLAVRGRPMAQPGAMVANHASWLDIFVLNAVSRVYFVSKSEVAGWAGIGWLARATGTVFITRKGAEAKAQRDLFEERLRAGHRLLFFPEGTSTDSLRILPFKSTLFAAFFTHGLQHLLHVQPVTVVYAPPAGCDRRFYGWWGDIEFAPHLLAVLARPGGVATVVLHPPVAVDATADRKALAAACEAAVRSAHPQGGVSPAPPEASRVPLPDRGPTKAPVPDPENP